MYNGTIPVDTVKTDHAFGLGCRQEETKSTDQLNVVTLKTT